MTLVRLIAVLAGLLASTAHAGLLGGFMGSPVEYDIRAFGAKCDLGTGGSTDDTAAIQKVVDYVNGLSAGGAIVIPDGVVCGVGAGGITAKSNVSWLGPGKLKAVAGLTNWLLGSSSAISNVQVRGVKLDLDQVAPLPAFSATNASNAGIDFSENVVSWNADGDSATGTNTTAFSFVAITTAAPAAAGTPSSRVVGNRVEGTNVDAQNDTCMTISIGGSVFFATGVVSGNQVDWCGGDGISVGGAAVVGNTFSGHDHGLTIAGGQTVVANNVVQARTTGPAIYSSGGNANNTLLFNNNVNILSAGAAVGYAGGGSGSAGGAWIIGGYYADGVELTSTGQAWTHCQIRDVECNTAGARPCVLVQNADKLTVMGVTDVTTTTSTYSSVKIENTDSVTDFDILVSNNHLNPAQSGPATRTGLELAGTTGSTDGFRGVIVTGNLFGASGVTLSNGIAITGSPTDLANILIDGNNFGYTTTPLSGFTSAEAIAATTIGDNVNLVSPGVIADLPAAGCVAAAAASFWDLPSSNAPAAACYGTNYPRGVLDFNDSTDQTAYTSVVLPNPWTGALYADIYWLATATTNEVQWGVQVACAGSSEPSDPSFLTASTVSTTVDATTTDITKSSVAISTLTNCAAGEQLHVKLYRDADAGGGVDDLSGNARLVRVVLRQ